MDNFNQTSNFNEGPGVVKTDLPNANMVLVLGIVSLCLDVILCCCYGGFPGLILAIIGLIMGNKAKKAYEADPSAYTEKSYKKAKTGTLLSIIGLAMGVLAVIFYIYALATGGGTNNQWEEIMRELK